LIKPVLGGDHEERDGQRMAGAIDADPAAGHRLQQGALGARAGPVDLIGQEHLTEQGAGLETEAATARFEHTNAREIGGEQVAGEVHPFEI
jgi:hypothetical protein